VDEEGYGTTGAQATTAGEEKGSARRNGKRRGALGSASRG